MGEGAERKPVPIPTEQKLKEHETKDQHKYNVRRAQEGSAVQPRSRVDMFMTVTSEDELYFRTIRTIHHVVIRLNSLNDVDSLLLQNANGLVKKVYFLTIFGFKFLFVFRVLNPSRLCRHSGLA